MGEGVEAGAAPAWVEVWILLGFLGLTRKFWPGGGHPEEPWAWKKNLMTVWVTLPSRDSSSM